MKLFSWEIRKLLGRKLSAILLAAVAFFIVLQGVGNIFTFSTGWQGEDMISHYYTGLEGIKWEKELCAPFDGRIIDDEFVVEVDAVFPDRLVASDDLHDICSSFILKLIANPVINDGETIQGQQTKVYMPVEKTFGDTEYLYRYGTGWRLLINSMSITGGIAAAAGIIMATVIYSGEYTSGTDALLLTSKYGKKKLAAVKFFACLTIPIVTAALSMGLLALILLSVFGFGGGDGSAALMFHSYNAADRLAGGFTAADFGVTYAGEAIREFGAIMMTTAICACVAAAVSAAAGSDFISVAATSCILLIPSAIGAALPSELLIDHKWLKTLFSFTPVNAIRDSAANWFRYSPISSSSTLRYLPILAILLAAAVISSFAISLKAYPEHQVR